MIGCLYYIIAVITKIHKKELNLFSVFYTIERTTSRKERPKLENPTVRRLLESHTKSIELNHKDTWRVVKNYYELDSAFNFQICCVKNRSAQNYLTEHMHVGSFEVVYMFKGKQSYTIDGYEQLVSAGQLVISPPNVCHTSGISPQERSYFYYMTISTDTLAALFSEVPAEAERLLAAFSEQCSKEQKVHTMKFPARIRQVCDSLIAMHGEQDPYINLRVRNAAAELILLTVDSASGETADSKIYTDDIETVKSYIHTHIKEPLSIDQLAQLSNYSKSAFSKKFKQYTGVTAYEYILRNKIELAKQMLLLQSASPAQIAELLSFSSERYFSDVFKRYTTMTPRKYVKLHAGQNIG